MIKINNIKKSYGKKQVLKGCNFTAAPGECIGIVGSNGSGKSTLLSIISGMRKADYGNIDINDSQSKIAYVPQDNPIYPELSVKDNLMLWYCDSKSSFETSITSGVIHLLGLDTVLKQRASTLSGGMKKRLSIAIAMAGIPNIILLDEPSAALDLHSKLIIRDYLNECLAKGCTVILTTHDEIELDICSRLLVLKDGLLTEIPTNLRGDNLLQMMNTSNQNQTK